MKKLVIAIDGPAASGKTTTSRLTARRLGYLHIDTGAMYRAMTLKILDERIDLADAAAVARVAASTAIRLERHGDDLRVLLDGVDVTTRIRTQAVTRNVSAVSMLREVRDVMVREQRRMGAEGGIVLEGRDIGTVVFPGADLKIYMVADVEERARRRKIELGREGQDVALEEIVREIAERDRKDSERDISPLCRAADAIELDTSSLTIEEQVDFIVKRAHSLMEQRA